MILIREQLEEREDEILANGQMMIDDIRCRNGNLNIVCGHVPDAKEEL